MHEYNDEIFFVRKGEVMRCFDALLYDSDQSRSDTPLEKSANTKTSEYIISVTTVDSFDSYKTYHFALNELEASFDLNTDEIKKIELRDTSVNKKIIFVDNKATLVNAKGQDVVGRNSEFDNITSKDIVYSLTVNGSDYIAPIVLEELYEGLTGLSFEDRSFDESETSDLSWWSAFLNMDKKVK